MLTRAGRRYRGVTNIGVRPTVTQDPTSREPVVETHLLDFEGDLYGCEINLELLLYLREERRFDNVQALAGQIRRDIERARRYFHWFEKATPANA
jgi:riboflavin kinase/FMN adenylyltransferase